MDAYIKYLMSTCAIAVLIPLQTNGTASQQIPRPPQAAGHAVHIVTDPQGNALAVWSQQTTGNQYANFGSLFQNGIWRTPNKISQDYSKDLNLAMPVTPQLCCDAVLHAIVIWAALDGLGNPALYGAAYIPGNALPTPIKISNDAQYIQSPSIAFYATGKAIVVWKQDDTYGHDAIYKAVFAPEQGTPVTDLEQVYASDGTFVIIDPFISYNSTTGQAAVAWGQYSTNPPMSPRLIHMRRIINP